ncbi:MAG TPA: hypothetical protein VHY79_11280, partial [Rhizomicrobium sp.]|nr:hypothetical protein [Rhizomicrobium sp.]
VLSLLAQEGLDVTGLDCSHLAFALAFPNVRKHMLFGDLLSVDLGRTFDAVIAMDIFEHLNPLKLGTYIERAAQLVDNDGYLFVNSPMFGTDPVFGSPFPLHLESWTRERQSDFWRHIPCDAKGWPWDGHLIWAAIPYWEQQFASMGLVRDIKIEAAIQRVLKYFFAEFAPARRAIFVLKKPQNRRESSEVAAQVAGALAAVDGLPKAG